MLEKTFMIRTTDIVALSKNKLISEVCKILSEKLKVRLSEEFPDNDVEVGVNFNSDAMCYAVSVFIYDDYESPKKPSPADKYRDRFIKSKGKPAGLKL